LRARSLEVSLVAEAMGLGLLQRLDLPPLLRILSAGGRFYLLLPNRNEVCSALEEAAETWQRWALEEGGSLVPLLAWVSFSPERFNDFGNVLRDGIRALGEAKLRPFDRVLGRVELPWATPEGGALRPCALCGLRPASRDEPGSLCDGCTMAEGIGQRLPRREQVGFFRTPPSRPYFAFPGLWAALEEGEYTLRARLDFSPSPGPFEIKPLLGHLPTVQEALQALRLRLLDEYARWLRENGLEEAGEVHPDRPLTFGELAALSTGADYLGGLMLDADRMGEVFAGLKGASPSRIASLSRAFSLFFSGEVLALLRTPHLYRQRLGWEALEAEEKARRYPLVYSVYAGGDDLFFLGPWDVLLDFALDLERLYRAFTRHEALTLSGGFALFRPSTPVPQMAEILRKSEKRAKAAGRGRLFLFGQAVEWKDLPELRGWAMGLEQDLKDGLSKAKVYRMLQLFRTAQAAQDPVHKVRYKPLLAYALRELENGLKSRYLTLLDHTHLAWRHLPVWAFWGLYRLREG
ncbi:MAG: type III-A CRISPR-associated protein Cas10/Csm1, partial [Thermoleophilia bacterium]